MLCTKQKVLRRFWYATMPVDKLAGGPKPFTLLGENIVLFLDAEGKPAALADRCCHRTAKLSKGWSEDGRIICGYHGWTYDPSGKLVSSFGAGMFGGAAGSCTVTRSPPPARGASVRVPSCAWVMLLTIASPRPTPAWEVRTRSVPR